jgi:hypothetical protein
MFTESGLGFSQRGRRTGYRVLNHIEQHAVSYGMMTHMLKNWEGVKVKAPGAKPI